MPLSEAMNERIGILLENLSSVRAQLNERAQSFVDDQIARHDKYGSQMFLSPKQLDWLNNLHDQFCKHAPPLPPGDEDERDDAPAATARGRDMDDDIPF